MDGVSESVLVFICVVEKCSYVCKAVFMFWCVVVQCVCLLSGMGTDFQTVSSALSRKLWAELLPGSAYPLVCMCCHSN